MNKKILSFIFMCLVLALSTGCKNKTTETTSADTPSAEDTAPLEVSIFSRPTVERVEGERKAWNDVSSFICYYGDFTDEQKNFDVVIMHSNTLYTNENAKEKVKELQDAGCYVIAYISIGEDDSLNVADGLGEGGYASYYIYENGFPKINSNWGSYFVDASNPVWQARIMDETSKIMSYGVDGLFLDTLDTVDVRPESIGGLTNLVKLMHETYPEAKLVANRGFNLLKYISPYISGLMFESFNTTYSFTDQMVEDLSDSDIEYNKYVACNVINAVRRYDYFPVFCLDYVNEYEMDYMPQYYYDNSWKYDFIPYCTYDILLATACNPGVTPKSERGSLALSTLGQDSLGTYNGDKSVDNLAYKDNGAKVYTDSTYPGYSNDPLNDAWYATDENHIQANWAKESWASMDTSSDHYVEFRFDAEVEISKLVVHWANDNGTYYSPQEATVQAYINNEWVDVLTLNNEPEEGSDIYKAFEQEWTYTFDTVTTTKIRLLQPKGKGCADKYNDPVRANIMWVSEIELYK